MEPWFEEARHIAHLEAEIYFLLQESFYYGPDDAVDLKPAVPLALPDIPRRVASIVQSYEAIGHEEKLAAYYEQIVRLSERYQKPFNRNDWYFWLRFRLRSEAENVEISFPYYDTISEVERCLTPLGEVASGEVYSGRDQCWGIDIHAHDGTLFMREHDPDYGEYSTMISVPRASVVCQIAPLRERTVKVIEQLSQLLGAGMWTSYVKSPALGFRPDVGRRWWRFR